MIDNTATGRALAWQIEHNGAWRWEVDGRWIGPDEVAVIVGGPNDVDHHWTIRLGPGEEFVTVPASVAVSRRRLAGCDRRPDRTPPGDPPTTRPARTCR